MALAVDSHTAMQKRTFTRWINFKLTASASVQDITQDLRNGHVLIELLNVLALDARLAPERSNLRIHKVINVGKVLSFLQKSASKDQLSNIGAEDIVDGNVKLTLGLVWVLVLRYQLADLVAPEKFGTANSSDIDNIARAMNSLKSSPSSFSSLPRSADLNMTLPTAGVPTSIIDHNLNKKQLRTRDTKTVLLRWATRQLSCSPRKHLYPHIEVSGFSLSWQNGLTFCLLVDSLDNECIPWSDVKGGGSNREDWHQNLSLAFTAATTALEIPQLLDPDDIIATGTPDEKSIMTYVSSFFVLAKTQSKMQSSVLKVSEKQLLDNVPASTKDSITHLLQDTLPNLWAQTDSHLSRCAQSLHVDHHDSHLDVILKHVTVVPSSIELSNALDALLAAKTCIDHCTEHQQQLQSLTKSLHQTHTNEQDDYTQATAKTQRYQDFHNAYTKIHVQLTLITEMLSKCHTWSDKLTNVITQLKQPNEIIECDDWIMREQALNSIKETLLTSRQTLDAAIQLQTTLYTTEVLSSTSDNGTLLNTFSEVISDIQSKLELSEVGIQYELRQIQFGQLIQDFYEDCDVCQQWICESTASVQSKQLPAFTFVHAQQYIAFINDLESWCVIMDRHSTDFGENNLKSLHVTAENIYQYVRVGTISCIDIQMHVLDRSNTIMKQWSDFQENYSQLKSRQASAKAIAQYTDCALTLEHEIRHVNQADYIDDDKVSEEVSNQRLDACVDKIKVLKNTYATILDAEPNAQRYQDYLEGNLGKIMSSMSSIDIGKSNRTELLVRQWQTVIEFIGDIQLKLPLRLFVDIQVESKFPLPTVVDRPVDFHQLPAEYANMIQSISELVNDMHVYDLQFLKGVMLATQEALSDISYTQHHLEGQHGKIVEEQRDIAMTEWKQLEKEVQAYKTNLDTHSWVIDYFKASGLVESHLNKIKDTLSQSLLPSPPIESLPRTDSLLSGGRQGMHSTRDNHQETVHKLGVDLSEIKISYPFIGNYLDLAKHYDALCDAVTSVSKNINAVQMNRTNSQEKETTVFGIEKMQTAIADLNQRVKAIHIAIETAKAQPTGLSKEELSSLKTSIKMMGVQLNRFGSKLRSAKKLNEQRSKPGHQSRDQRQEIEAQFRSISKELVRLHGNIVKMELLVVFNHTLGEFAVYASQIEKCLLCDKPHSVSVLLEQLVNKTASLSSTFQSMLQHQPEAQQHLASFTADVDTLRNAHDNLLETENLLSMITEISDSMEEQPLYLSATLNNGLPSLDNINTAIAEQIALEAQVHGVNELQVQPYFSSVNRLLNYNSEEVTTLQSHLMQYKDKVSDAFSRIKERVNARMTELRVLQRIHDASQFAERFLSEVSSHMTQLDYVTDEISLSDANTLIMQTHAEIENLLTQSSDLRELFAPLDILLNELSVSLRKLGIKANDTTQGLVINERHKCAEIQLVHALDSIRMVRVSIPQLPVQTGYHVSDTEYNSLYNAVILAEQNLTVIQHDFSVAISSARAVPLDSHQIHSAQADFNETMQVFSTLHSTLAIINALRQKKKEVEKLLTVIILIEDRVGGVSSLAELDGILSDQHALDSSFKNYQESMINEIPQNSILESAISTVSDRMQALTGQIELRKQHLQYDYDMQLFEAAANTIRVTAKQLQFDLSLPGSDLAAIEVRLNILSATDLSDLTTLADSSNAFRQHASARTQMESILHDLSQTVASVIALLNSAQLDHHNKDKLNRYLAEAYNLEECLQQQMTALADLSTLLGSPSSVIDEYYEEHLAQCVVTMNNLRQKKDNLATLVDQLHLIAKESVGAPNLMNVISSRQATINTAWTMFTQQAKVVEANIKHAQILSSVMQAMLPTVTALEILSNNIEALTTESSDQVIWQYQGHLDELIIEVEKLKKTYNQEDLGSEYSRILSQQHMRLVIRLSTTQELFAYKLAAITECVTQIRFDSAVAELETKISQLRTKAQSMIETVHPLVSECGDISEDLIYLQQEMKREMAVLVKENMAIHNNAAVAVTSQTIMDNTKLSRSLSQLDMSWSELISSTTTIDELVAHLADLSELFIGLTSVKQILVDTEYSLQAIQSTENEPSFTEVEELGDGIIQVQPSLDSVYVVFKEHFLQRQQHKQGEANAVRSFQAAFSEVSKQRNHIKTLHASLAYAMSKADELLATLAELEKWSDIMEEACRERMDTLKSSQIYDMQLEEAELYVQSAISVAQSAETDLEAHETQLYRSDKEYKEQLSRRIPVAIVPVNLSQSIADKMDLARNAITTIRQSFASENVIIEQLRKVYIHTRVSDQIRVWLKASKAAVNQLTGNDNLSLREIKHKFLAFAPVVDMFHSASTELLTSIDQNAEPEMHARVRERAKWTITEWEHMKGKVQDRQRVVVTEQALREFERVVVNLERMIERLQDQEEMVNLEKLCNNNYKEGQPWDGIHIDSLEETHLRSAKDTLHKIQGEAEQFVVPKLTLVDSILTRINWHENVAQAHERREEIALKIQQLQTSIVDRIKTVNKRLQVVAVLRLYSEADQLVSSCGKMVSQTVVDSVPLLEIEPRVNSINTRFKNYATSISRQLDVAVKCTADIPEEERNEVLSRQEMIMGKWDTVQHGVSELKLNYELRQRALLQSIERERETTPTIILSSTAQNTHLSRPTTSNVILSSSLLPIAASSSLLRPKTPPTSRITPPRWLNKTPLPPMLTPISPPVKDTNSLNISTTMIVESPSSATLNLPKSASALSPTSPETVRIPQITTYHPDPTDEVDVRLADIVNELGVFFPIKKIGPGKYCFGEIDAKILNCRLVQNNILVRIGGGWTGLCQHLLGSHFFQLMAKNETVLNTHTNHGKASSLQ